MTAKATTSTAESPGDGILRIGESAEEPKYDVLFRIRGKEYQGTTNPSGQVLFAYLDVQRKRGQDTALSWLLEKVLQPDAYRALLTDEAVSKPDFDAVCDVVRNLVFGRDSSPKPPGRDQRRTSG